MESRDFLKEDYNMDKIENPVDSQGVYAGFIEGFPIVLTEDGQQYNIIFGARVGDNKYLIEELKALQNLEGLQLQEVKIHPYTVEFIGEFTNADHTFQEAFSAIIDGAVSSLSHHGAPPADFISGETGQELRLVEHKGRYVYVTEETSVQGTEDLATLSEETKRTFNGKAFLGALLGLLIGLVIYGMIYYYGFTATIGSFIAGFLAFYLYNRRQGKINVQAILIILACLLMGVYLTQEIANLMKLRTIFDPPLALNETRFIYNQMKKEPQMASQLNHDLLAGILYAILGSGLSIYLSHRGNKEKNDIQPS